ncbi:MAG: ABC transporter substrate-binding protein [Lachnospiraceae bacterium]
MKNGFMRKLALAMAAVMVAGSLTACGDTTDAPAETTPSTETTTADTTEATTTETAGNEDNNTLVVGMDYFSSKFSTFFSKTSYDTNVADMTTVYLLTTDRGGAVVMNGIEGETVPYNGTDYTYYGMGDCVVTQNDDGTVYYDITIRDDVTFSDGTPVTIDDAIFSMYVLCDPTYDGSGSLYAQPIVGMDEYRSGMESLTNLLAAAGRDNTDFTYWTEEEQTAFWTALDAAGDIFVQEIVDYCVAALGDYLSSVGDSEVALGMYAWGFGAPNEDGTKITGAGTGTEYDTATVTNADYFYEMLEAYGYDLLTLSDVESAGSDLLELLYANLGDAAANYQKGVNTGDSAPSIAGIEKTGDYSMRITMSKFDATSIYTVAGIPLAPMHYYGSADLYDYDNNSFGFVKGDLSLVRSKTTSPMGAGPYVFQSYENGVVTFTANDTYFKGTPKTKTILFKETPSTDKLTGIASGTFDISDPSINVSVLDSIKGYNSNGEIAGDVLTTELIDFRGYGYMGICAENVKVGDDKGSEESKALRKAFATMLAVYRDTVVNSYYGEMAEVIQYPISNTSWAAPQPADEGYEIAYSKDVDGNPIYTADMSEEEKYEAALQAAIGFFKKAGYTWDEAEGKFTAAPEGAELTYEFIIAADGVGDHPLFGILTAVKEALAPIGITLEINDPSDSNELWNKLEGGTGEMWAAAWQATADPDMYQIYYSTNVVGGGGTESNHYSIQDDTLDELIMEARESADQSFRKATYKEAMDIILDWGVEIPAYQRQEANVFSTERINIDSLAKDMTPYYGWLSEVENIEMN